MTHDQAERAIQKAGDRFTMVIERVNFKKYEKTPADISASHTLEALRHENDHPGEVTLEERPRSRARILEPDPGLKPKDRGRMGNNDVSKKANLQKDWNCPWVSKDGSRLKQ